ncbi:PAS domain-containing protein [Bradyrhizobium sp. SYSU BS000235]|uniref:PAS domain-containing protein n=1 Tax=Bradyrhizobium sp. SYSU BS000235 TaxID=3411332 RepID=UPI003C7736C9
MSVVATDDLTEIFPGDSIMARLMRQWDWNQIKLGDPRQWPDGLKIPLRMLLTSRFEMWLGWGPDLLFFYNDAYIPTLGLKHPSMLGKPFREVWAEVYAEVAGQVERVRAGEATWNKALLLLLERSGYPEETYHSFSYSPLYGQGPSVEGMLCVVSEETERIISERRIDMLRHLGSELVGASDQHAVRQAVCSVLGANRRDFPFALLYLGNEGHACTADAGSLLNEPWPLQDRQVLKNGRVIQLREGPAYPVGEWRRPPVEAIMVPVPGAHGHDAFGTLILGLNPHRRHDPNVMDIARLVAGQVSGAMANVGALQSERRRADRIWSHARDLMVVVGADGIYRSVSPAWTRILGHPLEDVIGHSFREFVLPDDILSTADGLQQAATETDLTGFENRLRTADGSFRWISWHTAMEEGLVFGYGRDITEQKANEAALMAAEDALRQAQKMEAVGQLTGGIAHDFNNLLTGIIGSLDLMQRRLPREGGSDLRRLVSVATASANRAAALTQRLLAFSRRQSLDPKSIDANELVHGMEDLIRRSIGEAIDLKIVTRSDLWPTKCDPNQLESAILNLAINSRDAMPNGGQLVIETGHAWIDRHHVKHYHGAAYGDYVVISVIDTGHGMSQEIASKAFDPFFTTKPIGQGTGLGLSMIYGFAQQSNGFAEIESKEGQGTTVRIFLPRNEEVHQLEVYADVERSDGRSHGEEIVLVVEDEAAVRAFVIDVLQEVGYRTLEAANGASGLQLLESNIHDIDLLLTDVGLPGGLNGRQLADAGRVLRPDLKVLFMTGYAFNAAVGNGYLEPGMAIITKPFAADKLAGHVENIIKRKLVAPATQAESRLPGP